jgi:predicted CXXCH cytochrome family protein
MANASGPAMDGLITGELEQRSAGIDYRVHESDGKVLLSFASRRDPEVRGKRQLRYYIGSGKRGRTYLFSVDGFWFESPVNWYGQKKAWDMTPAYQDAREAPLNLPLAASCLACHTSGMSAPAAGTENRYGNPLFQHVGITCKSCHGDGKAHVAGGKILNPAKLDPERRDSICMRCHLEGNAAIEQPGKHLYDFRPGDDLAQYVRYFVKASVPGENLRAASQFEALAQSACRKKSGESMSCTSCHDPHASPKPEERAAFYREKCLACHGEKFASRHHGEHPDCIGCHMPPVASSDVAHTQATDHRILRRPENASGFESLHPVVKLVEFPPRLKSRSNLRDLALAWESMEKKGTPGAAREVEELLPKALAQNPEDPDLLAAYGYEEQKKGASARARDLYERALRSNPDAADVETNFAVLKASTGDTDGAIALWRRAFERKPWQDSIGVDLALTLCEGSHYEEARDVILRVLEFSPDSGAGKELLRRVNADRPNGCR